MSTAIIIGASVAAATLIGVLAFSWSGLTVDKSGETPLKTKETSPQEDTRSANTLAQATKDGYGNQSGFASFGAVTEGGGRKRKSKRCKSRKRKTKTKRR